MRLTKKQTQLYETLKTVLKAGPLCTADLRRALGCCQAYEGYLRNRLFRLYGKGLLEYTETLRQGYCLRRDWTLKEGK